MVRKLITPTLIAILSLFLTTCKKEECPVPVVTPVPIHNKIIVWTDNANRLTYSPIYVVIHVPGYPILTWEGLINLDYTSIPECDTYDCFTLECDPGSYTIDAYYYNAVNTKINYNTIIFNVAANSGCNNLNLQ